MKIEVATTALSGPLPETDERARPLVRPGSDPPRPEIPRIHPPRSRGRPRRNRRGHGFLAPGAGDAQERARLPPHPGRRRHGAPRRYRGRLRRHATWATCSTCSAPPAIRACRSTARPSTTPRAWSTSGTSSTSSPCAPTAARRKPDRATRRPPPSLGQVDLSMTLAAAKILRPVLFVPRSMPAIDLLVRMQATRTHMALVIDEYGGTDGLVSIEDLVEMVVGDIEDEHDERLDADDRRGGRRHLHRRCPRQPRRGQGEPRHRPARRGKRRGYRHASAASSSRSPAACRPAAS